MSFPGPHNNERVAVIVVAAGQSQRMGGLDKIFSPVAGRPILAWTLQTFEHSPLVDDIVVAVERHHIMDGRALKSAEGWRKVSQVCRGGARRQDSVREALWRLGKSDWVVVHDGARPCIDDTLLLQALEAAQETGAAAPGLPITDTLKRTDEHGIVTETLDRAGLWAIQTPQVFRRQLLWDAHQQVTQDMTDDCAMVEALGHRVRVFPGSAHNIKLTVPQDLDAVASYLSPPATTVSA